MDLHKLTVTLEDMRKTVVMQNGDHELTDEEMQEFFNAKTGQIGGLDDFYLNSIGNMMKEWCFNRKYQQEINPNQELEN